MSTLLTADPELNTEPIQIGGSVAAQNRCASLVLAATLVAVTNVVATRDMAGPKMIEYEARTAAISKSARSTPIKKVCAFIAVAMDIVHYWREQRTHAPTARCIEPLTGRIAPAENKRVAPSPWRALRIHQATLA